MNVEDVGRGVESRIEGTWSLADIGHPPPDRVGQFQPRHRPCVCRYGRANIDPGELPEAQIVAIPRRTIIAVARSIIPHIASPAFCHPSHVSQAQDIVELNSPSPRVSQRVIGGEGGIRTLGTLARSTVFETAPIDHSGTSPHVRPDPYGRARSNEPRALAQVRRIAKQARACRRPRGLLHSRHDTAG